MADFDIQALLQNPLFLAGTGALLAEPQDRYKGFLGGLQQGNQLQQAAQLNRLRQLQIAAEEQRQNFDPSAYMKTAPVSQGMAAPNAWAAQQANQMPATLGGPIGGQTQMPQAPTAGVNTQVTPEPGTPTGQVDMAGLLQGGMQAGLSPQAIQQVAGIIDPVTAAQQAAAAKMAEPYNLSPGQTRNIGNTVIASNTNAPPGSPLATIQALTTARDQLPQGSPMWTTLDTALRKASGEQEQQQSDRNFQATQAQREFTQGMQKQSFDQRQQQQVQQQTAAFSNNLQKAGIPAMQQQLDTIDAILQKHKGTDNEVPGYGRVQGAVPGMFLSPDAQELRQAVQSLANVVLKSRSGAAVTEPEQKRFIIELGSGAWMPEDQLLKGLSLMRGIVNSEKTNAAAGASNDVLDTYSATPGAIDMTGYKRPDTGNRSGGGGIAIQSATADDIAAAIARKKGAK